MIGRGMLYTVFGTWFLATLVSQEPNRKHPGLRTLDPTGLFIADWRFFAPRPGMNDNHVLFRDELEDGTYTDWKEIAPTRTRRLSHVIFYPTRRSEKAVTDAVSSLLMVAASDSLRQKEDIQLSIAYLALLNYVTSQAPHAKNAVKTQFAVATSTGYEEDVEPEVSFLSNVHRLS